ncbi:MAG TPA: DUF6159 family protein [Kofleriaceae bacterium]|nr:DUF6159 family protein [Kofleriaceae bacterium]
MTVLQAIALLTKASWRVLRAHPILMWFPVFSLVSTIAVVLLLGPIVLRGEPTWLALFVLGLAAQLVHLFWRVGLTAEALKALRGGTPNISEGVLAAASRPTAILSLGLVSATVGLVLAVLGRSSRGALRVARAVIGTAWSLATYLAIPVMVQERRGGIPSLRRSGDLFRKTWGETALSEVGLRVITAHLSVVLVLIALAIIELLGESGWALLAVLALVAGFVGVVGALEAIYRAALYVFASEGVVPAPFGGPELHDIWQVK